MYDIQFYYNQGFGSPVSLAPTQAPSNLTKTCAGRRSARKRVPRGICRSFRTDPDYQFQFNDQFDIRFQFDLLPAHQFDLRGRHARGRLTGHPFRIQSYCSLRLWSTACHRPSAYSIIHCVPDCPFCDSSHYSSPRMPNLQAHQANPIHPVSLRSPFRQMTR